VSEWQTYNRIKFQMHVRELAKGRRGNVEKDNVEKGIQLFNESKGEQIRVLRLDNDRMLQAIHEIQDQLALINPPHHFYQFKLAESENELLRREIGDLQHEVQRLTTLLAKHE